MEVASYFQSIDVSAIVPTFASISSYVLVAALVYTICSLVSWFRRRIRFIRMVNALPGPSPMNHKYPITADLGPIIWAPSITISEGVKVADISDAFLNITKEFHEKGHGVVRQWGFHPYHTPIAQSFILAMDPYCVMDILRQTASTAPTAKIVNGKKQRHEPAFEKPLDEGYRGVLPLLGPSILTMPDGHHQLRLQRKAGTPTSTIISHAHDSTRDLVEECLFPFWDAQNEASKFPSATTSATAEAGEDPRLGLDMFVQAKHLMVDISGMVTVSKTFNAAKALRDGAKATMYHDILYLDTEAAIRNRDPLRSATHFTKFNQALKRLDKFFMDAVDQRKKDLAAAAAGSSSKNQPDQANLYNKDMLSGLLKAEDKMEDGYLLGNLRLLLYGAYDSTASVLTWTLWELATHPEYQERVYDEIEPLGAEPTLHDLSKCVFLNQVINEALRLYSPTLVSRRATRDVEIGRGDKAYTIPKHSTVVVMPLCVNRLSTPDNPDADKFIPNREIHKKVGAMRDDPHARNIAFSLTPRHCIGSSLALTKIRSSLATILYSFEVSPTQNAPQPKLLLNLNFNPHDVYVDFARRRE